jgi:hypothetical protein
MKEPVIRKLLSDDPHIRWEEPFLTAEQSREMWRAIKKVTVKKNPARLFAPSRVVAWVASVAAVVTIGMVVWHHVAEARGEERYLSILLSGDEDDFDPAASDVVLKSGDRTVSVQTDRADVVYDDKGKPVVNSQEIAPNTASEKKEESKPEAKFDRLMVPYGKVASLTLSDGTKIWVNSGSRLVYRSVFGDDVREVWLTGEAYFDVAKEENRPFVIKTEQMDVAVRGTALNVSAYNSEQLQTVALVSGLVDVTGRDGKTIYKMEPNQLFSYDRSLSQTGISNVDVAMYTSWIHGYLLLEDESLDRLLAKIDRHYNVRINLDDDRIHNIRVSGKLDLLQGLEKALETISTTTPVDFETGNDGVAVRLTLTP